MKIIPIYKNKIISLPFEIVTQKLSTATKEELAVLIAVLAEPEFEVKSLAAKLDMTENSFTRALETWKREGVILEDSDSEVTSLSETSSDAAEIKTRKKNSSRIEIHTTLPHYTSEEIAAAVERTHGCSELLDSCQQILGKMFNVSETSIIIGLIDHLSLQHEYIVLLCSHAAAIGKKSVRYIEKLALNLYDRDITTYPSLEEELKLIEARASLESYVRTLFGFGKRALIQKEKEMIKAWSEKFNFSRDMIKAAYEITVSRTNEPNMKYTNGILENWYAAGYKTPEEVEAAEAERNRNKDKTQASSFATDDFYEAALKRSYGSDN
ncbi:MAG: DnaD domain protein [Ruminococcaceae bacterium]|nr:DnaD domain protein [Oscillospiraceae bacterium]